MSAEPLLQTHPLIWEASNRENDTLEEGSLRMSDGRQRRVSVQNDSSCSLWDVIKGIVIGLLCIVGCLFCCIIQDGALPDSAVGAGDALILADVGEGTSSRRPQQE